MIRPILALMALILCIPSAVAQDGDVDNPIWRMVQYRIVPGQSEAFWKDIRENGIPILNKAVEAGAFEEFRWFTNPLIENENDWNAMVMIKFRNYAQLDLVGPRAAKVYADHYGGAENAAIESAKRDQWRTVVKYRLIHEYVPD